MEQYLEPKPIHTSEGEGGEENMLLDGQSWFDECEIWLSLFARFANCDHREGGECCKRRIELIGGKSKERSYIYVMCS